MGGIIDLKSLRRPPRTPDHRSWEGVDAELAGAMSRLQDRCARLLEAVAGRCEPDRCEPRAAPRPCAAYQAIVEVLEVAAGAEAHLLSALERALRDASSLAQLASAAHDLAALEGEAEVVAAIPRLALAFARCAAAALVQVDGGGAVETLARCGGAFEAPAWRIAEEARAALRDDVAAAECRLPCDGERAAWRTDRMALVPLSRGREGLVLVLERAASSAALGEGDVDRLAVYAAFAATALAAARSGATLRQTSARDAATLGALSDGVIDVDPEGVVRTLNQAACGMLALRRADVLGRTLAEVPGLAALATALAGPTGQVAEVVPIPRGEVVVRAQRYAGGVVATLRDAATGQTIAHHVVGSVARYTFDHLVGASPEFLQVMEEADRAARCDVPVLVCGESGTGKEMLAQAIHNASPHASEPFLGLNVTAIPRELLESELFGYEGGTFTGARASGRAGKFELAGRGTLLLDEIGDMPLEMQGKLLRVLQERIVQRLGSARDIPVRARIIATTHRDLGEAVEQGRFRLDLYHRLRVLQLRIPPLRERKGDVPLLVERQLQGHAERTHRRIDIAPHVLAALEAHDWPGNVRELLNAIEGELSVLAPEQTALTRVPAVLLQPPPRPRPAPDAASEIVPLEELERLACGSALAAFNGNVASAARALCVSKVTLYAKIRRYGIALPRAPRRRLESGAQD
jgi:sigma-54 dependent transcriptional regulator, acetoin dehydrogenase operon transcriptional activator AcoR